MLDGKNKTQVPRFMAGVFLILAFWSFQKARAQHAEPLTQSHLRIEWDFESSKRPKKMAETRKLWRKVCKNLGTKLSPGKGPWGLGFFTSFNCFLKKKRVFGRKSRYKHWHLGFKDTSDGLKIEIRKASRKKSAKNRGKLLYSSTLEESEQSLQVLDSQEILEVLALNILVALPAQLNLDGMLQTVDNLDIVGAAIEEGSPLEEIPPPKLLKVYNLKWMPQSKLWAGEVLTTAKIKKAAAAAKTLHARKAAEGASVWRIQEKGKIKALLGVYAGFLDTDPGLLAKIDGLMSKTWDEGVETQEANILANAGSALGGLLSSTVSSAYVGLRYGLPVLAGSLFLDQATFFGTVAEFRSGLLDGLRLYVDHWPQIKEEVDGQSAEFGGTRIIIGWALKLEVPLTGFTFDLTPKVGVWTLITKLPLSLEDANTGEKTTQTVEFNIKDSLSIGIETGLEYASELYLLRGWFAQDLGISLKASQTSEVKTQRFGLDGLLALPSEWLFGKGLNLSALGFGFLETVSVSKTVEEADLQASEVAIENLDFRQAYVGGGIAVSW